MPVLTRPIPDTRLTHTDQQTASVRQIMLGHNRLTSVFDGARSELVDQGQDRPSDPTRIQLHPRGENPYLYILEREGVDMEDEVEALLRDDPRFEDIDVIRKDVRQPLDIQLQAYHIRKGLWESAKCLRQADLWNSYDRQGDDDAEYERVRQIFIGLVRKQWEQNPYFSIHNATRNGIQREQDRTIDRPLWSSDHTPSCYIRRPPNMDFKGADTHKKPRAAFTVTDSARSQTPPSSETSISPTATYAQRQFVSSYPMDTTQPSVYRARYMSTHSRYPHKRSHPSSYRGCGTTKEKHQPPRSVDSSEISSLEEIPDHIRRRLPSIEDQSSRAHFHFGSPGQVIILSPLLPLPRHNQQWREWGCWWSIQAEMNRIEVADYKPLVPDLVKLDGERYNEHMKLQDESLLWQLPPQMIAAARRVYVDGGDKVSMEEEARVSKNMKTRRRMTESQVFGEQVKGNSGTATGTPTWAFVWARRNGLLDELNDDDGRNGYPVLPAVVAALVIERAVAATGRSWEFLLWRAICSERVRRQAEVDFVQANGRRPVWTSSFSTEAWYRYEGKTQKASFNFASATRSHTLNELDQRFNDARVAFKRTLRYWRWTLFKRCEVDSMPSLESCGIPRKLPLKSGNPLRVSSRRKVLT